MKNPTRTTQVIPRSLAFDRRQQWYIATRLSGAIHIQFI